MKKGFRLALGALVVALTIAAFAYYLSNHQYVLRQLKHLPPTTVAWLLALYGAWFGAIILTMQAVLRLCGEALPIGLRLLHTEE